MASGTDVAVFPGGGQPPVVESFRLETRGFVELAAIAHLGPAVAALVRMRELDSSSSAWRKDAQRLIDQLHIVRETSTIALWRDQIAVAAWEGRAPGIVDLVDYACAVTTDYLLSALAEDSCLTFAHLRGNYLEASEPGAPPIPFNQVMVATFCLTALDISHRMISWLNNQNLDWRQLMVLVTGQSGRATAGLTWSSNNMCHLLMRASKGKLCPKRLYIAPDTANPSEPNNSNPERWSGTEHKYRTLWFNTHVNAGLAGRMFEGYPRYEFATPRGSVINHKTMTVNELPVISSPEDIFTFVARLRFVLEDPRQLISNCVADYVIDQLCEHEFQPERVQIPGFTHVAYPTKA